MTTTAPAPERRSRQRTRKLDMVPALDGFRGVAVLLVLLVHLQLLMPFEQTGVERVDDFIKGGFLGVDLFFVLSGFLITALLLNEQDRRGGGVGYRSFYVRRGLRLLPALYVFLIAHVGFALTTSEPLDREIPSVLSALLYVTNWQSVVAPDSLGHHFTHLWSLAIEEQFYLIWPATLIGYLGLRKDARHVTRVLVVAVVGVAIWRAWLLADGELGVDLIVRTDTRIDALLIGALVGSLWVRRATPTRGLSSAAWGATAVLLLLLVQLDGFEHFTYQGGLTLVAGCAAVIVLALVDGSWAGARFFELRPLQAVGRVSYGLYLWHYPVFFAVGRYMADEADLVKLAVALPVTAVVVTVSWFVVELPALALKQRFAGVRQGSADASAPDRLIGARWAITGLAAFGLGLGLGAVLGEEPSAAIVGDSGFPTGDSDRSDYWAYASLAPSVTDDFSDDATFAESDADPWTIISGRWEVQDGTAVVVPDADVPALAVLDDERSDSEGVIEVTLPVAEPGSGLLFRFRDIDNHWSVTAGPGLTGWLVERTLEGETTLVSEIPIEPVDNATVSVTQGGLSLRILLEGDLAVELFDDSLADVLRGGLVSVDGAGGARWDRFAVYRPVAAGVTG